MRVSKLVNDDWTFGNGRANYAVNADAVRQNVKTRLRSFKNDWFLDIEANIDWITLNGMKNNRVRILREVERVTLNTNGVTTINTLEVVKEENRHAVIKLAFSTIFDRTFEEEIKI